MPDPMKQFQKSILEDKFNSAEMLLRATEPTGYKEYYNPRSPLLGKELSLGVVEKTDMMANLEMVWTILEFWKEGQIELALDFTTAYQNDWKSTMSINAEFLRSLTTQEMKYTQTQELHEYQHPPPKKGLFGGKPKEQP